MQLGKVTMKIRLLLACLACAALLSACATNPARGGSADAAIVNAPCCSSQNLAQQASAQAQPDYRDVLSDPGWF